ncbi:hypothetical protein ACROYT_G012862 [Oculina patagonica]
MRPANVFIQYLKVVVTTSVFHTAAHTPSKYEEISHERNRKKMNFVPAFLVVALIFISVTWVQSLEQYCDTSLPEVREFAMVAMKKCNSNIKKCYEDHQGKPVENLYCKGMEILVKCAYREGQAFANNYPCRSQVLDRWLFVSYQYALIGKRLGMCTYDADFQSKLDNLKTKFDSWSNLYDVPAYVNKNVIYATSSGNAEKACARAIHDECAERLVATNPDLCSSVVDFVGCYNGKVGVKPPSVPAECVVNNIPRVPTISTTFNDLIQAFSTYLIGVYQADQARMCQVHESDLEGDCYAD